MSELGWTGGNYLMRDRSSVDTSYAKAAQKHEKVIVNVIQFR